MTAFSPGAAPDMRAIGGVAIAALRQAEAVQLIAERIAARRFTPVAFANAHCVNAAQGDAAYRTALADFLVLPDGVGVDIGSRVLHGAAFPANLNGTDFVPALLRDLPRPARVALVGGAPGVAETAARRLVEACPRHTVRAVSDGFFDGPAQTEATLRALRGFAPDITLVALGVPRQELFIARHLTERETTVAVAVGALFDFLSGNVPRAPAPWRRARLEWLFRLAHEPRRLWRRYVVGNPRFLLLMLAERLRRRSPAR